MKSLILQKERRIMNYVNRVIINPGIMLGKPVIKGTRVTVELF